MDIINYFAERQYVKKLLNDSEMDIKKVFWYCKNCKKCERFFSIKSELKKKAFQTYSKHIRYWDIRDPKFNERNRNFEIRPIMDSKFRM